MLEGLNYLHANGIIYADLKPSNVLLNEYGNLKLSDFGHSKKIKDLEEGYKDKIERVRMREVMFWFREILEPRTIWLQRFSKTKESIVSTPICGH